MKKISRYVCLSVLLITSVMSAPVYSLDSITPGNIYSDASLSHIGVRWQISDDDDLDAVCSVRFRKSGTSVWKEGMNLVRTHPGLYGEGGDRPENRFAGSIFFVESNTEYDIELSLSDPDGGGSVQTISARALSKMVPSDSAIERYVIPGSGGGTGTSSDPFRGLQSACDQAQAGNIFNIAAGTYSSCTLSVSGSENNPVVFRGPVNPNESSEEATLAVLDGGNTDRGIFTLGEYNIQTSYIIIENLVIQNGMWGIDAQNTHHILFQNNLVRNVGYGYYNRRDNGQEGYQMISDSVFTGRTAWPGSGIPSERGIDLRGTDNSVCYNRVSNFGDGISIQPFTDAYGYSNDIYGNDISNIVDDPIEIDYNSANTRVWGNRVTNGRMGISLAPIYGGPVYIFRNEFMNLESSAYKMNREPAGLVIVHNTSAKIGNGTSSPSGWQNTFLRNNVILGTQYVFEEYGLVSGSSDDWDYDALGTVSTPFAKWDNDRFQSIADLQAGSGIESHSVSISLSDLENTTLPSDYADGINPGSYDMRLKAGVNAINAGDVLPNINDPYVTDGLPDCGAFEYGKAMPEYGPRLSTDNSDDEGNNNSDTTDSDDNSSDASAAGSSDSSGGCFIYSVIAGK